MKLELPQAILQGLGGALMGFMVAIAIRPAHSWQEALRRVIACVLTGTILTPMLINYLQIPPTFETTVGIGFIIALLAWWVLTILLGTLEKRKDQDAIELVREIKSGASETDTKESQ